MLQQETGLELALKERRGEYSPELLEYFPQAEGNLRRGATAGTNELLCADLLQRSIENGA